MEINKHRKQFGNQAKNYTKYRKPYTDELFKLFFSLLPEEGNKVLDIACGTGKSTEPLATEGLEVYGVDHDPLMVQEAKEQASQKNLNINYSVAEVENLPFEDNTFSAITVGTAFHWFVNETALQEIKRVLKDGGLLFIYWTLTTKDIPEEDSIPSEIFKSFNWERVSLKLRDLEYISSFLSENGFKNVSTEKIPFTYTSTVEEQVGLLKTASSYELLSEEDKKEFEREVTEVLTKKLGERPHFVYEEEEQICYGFK